MNKAIHVLLQAHLKEIKYLNLPELHKFIQSNIIDLSLGHFLQQCRSKTLFLFVHAHTNYNPRKVPNWISEELLTELIYDGAISMKELQYSLQSIEYKWGGNSNWGSNSKVVDLLRASELSFSDCKQKVHSYIGLQIENKRINYRNDDVALKIKSLNSLGLWKHRDIYNILNACDIFTPTRKAKWNESSFSRFLERNNIKITPSRPTLKITLPKAPSTEESVYVKGLLKVLKTMDKEQIFRPKVVDDLILNILKPHRKSTYGLLQYIRQYIPSYYEGIKHVCGGKSIVAALKYPECRGALVSYLETLIVYLENGEPEEDKK